MKRGAALLFLMIGLTPIGCSGLLGAGAGAAGTAAAYEAHSKYELDKLERDYEEGKLDKQEYEARKKEVERGSLIY